MFEQELFAGWGDMDFNSHMKNTAYLDKSADVRMLYFASQGFPMAEFMRLRIGPVVMKDEIEYFRELHLLDRMIVRLTRRQAGGARHVHRGLARPEPAQADLPARAAAAGAAGHQPERGFCGPAEQREPGKRRPVSRARARICLKRNAERNAMANLSFMAVFYRPRMR
jgi:acyl-CoA thioesterase FadM